MRRKMVLNCRSVPGVLAALAAMAPLWAADEKATSPPQASRIALKRDDKAGRLRALIDGSEAFVYRYGAGIDLPYIVPRSPSGKPMTVVRTKPYPHHRSIWFADTVQLAGKRKVSFYNAYYTRIDRKDPNSPFRDRVRHVSFGRGKMQRDEAILPIKLLWEMDLKTPVLDEARRMRIVALGGGEYFLDVTFTVTASYGDVTFLSDAVHYAWPYVRMAPAFSVDKGGRITNSTGGANQKGTNGKVARWVDYSGTVKAATEGLAVFSHTDNAQPHEWLTRNYGTFGPRRAAARSGKRFTLRKGQSLTRRVGLLVHRGGVKEGKVARRYELYVKGKP